MIMHVIGNKTIQKYGGGKIFDVLCSPRLHYKYSKNCDILLEFKIDVFYVNIY